MRRTFLFTILIVLTFVFNKTKIYSQTSTPNQNIWQTNGIVRAIKNVGEDVFLGGDFTYVGPNTGSSVIINSSTLNKETIQTPYINGDISSVITDGNNGWYISGTFTKVGEYNRTYFAHILENGTVDENWYPGDGSVGYVEEMILDPTRSYVYVCGSFTKIGNTSINYLARLNTNDGTLDTTWNPQVVASSPVKGVRSMAFNTDGSVLYFGGGFTSVRGTTRYGIAAMNTANTNLNSWYPTGGVVSGSTNGQSIYKIFRNNDVIYVGGLFSRIGGQNRSNFAAINSSGTVTSLTTNPNGYISAITYNDNRIYIGGVFTTVKGLTRRYITSIDPTTGDPGSLTLPLTDAGSSVRSILIHNGKIYFGGYLNGYINALGYRHNFGIANANDNTILDNYFGANGGVMSITLNNSGDKIFIGGSFTSMGGVVRERIAKLTQGSVNVNWDPQIDDRSVKTLAIKDKHLYVGGNFTSINGIDRRGLASISTEDGTLEDWAVAENGADVLTMQIVENVLYAGGSFWLKNDDDFENVISFDARYGGLRDWWKPSPDGDVNAVAASSDNSNIYIGGDFTTVEEQSHNNLAKLKGRSDYGNCSLTSIDSTESFENSDLPSTWNTGGNSNWTIDSSTNISGSKSIGVALNDNEQSFIETTVDLSSQKTISFWWRASSEGGYDFLVFCLDNHDCTATSNYIKKTSGQTGWEQVFYTIPSGTHTLTWKYIRDDVYGQGLNKVWLDNISFGNINHSLCNTGPWITNWSPEPGGTIYSLGLSSDNKKLAVGGYFSTIASQSISNLAMFNTENDTIYSDWNPRFDSNPDVIKFSSDNNILYLGGGFWNIGDTQSPFLTTIDPNTAQILSWHPQPNDWPVYTIEITEETIFVGGDFTAIDGNNQRYFAQFGDTPEAIISDTTPTEILPTPTTSDISDTNNQETIINSSNSTSTQAFATCTNAVPLTPDLFEIDTNKSSATVYYNPPVSGFDKVFISYGYKPDKLIFGIEIPQKPTGGVLNYTVKELLPSTTYYFKIRTGNGCMPGEWSKTMKATTTNSNKLIKKFYANSPKVSSVFTSDFNQSSPTAILEELTPTPTPPALTTKTAEEKISQNNPPKQKQCFFWICW